MARSPAHEEETASIEPQPISLEHAAFVLLGVGLMASVIVHLSLIAAG